MNTGERMTISGASRLFARHMYETRSQQLSVGTMITGFDHKGGHLYYLDNDGNRIEGDKFSIGSGSTFAYGVLDNYWRFDMSLEEAVLLGKRAISEATFHDSASGGVVNVYHVFPGGWRKVVDREDNNNLVWKHREEKGVSFFDQDLFFKKKRKN